MSVKIDKNLFAKNVIVTPFLPPRVFREYLAEPSLVMAGRFSLLCSHDITVLRTGIGERAVRDALALLQDSVCEKIYFVGSCGGLAHDIGEILLPEKALAAVRGETGPDAGLAAALEACACAQDVRVNRATIFCAETPDYPISVACELQAQGMAGIELETSGFFSEAQRLGRPACALLYVTDTPLAKPFTARHTVADRQKITAARDAVVRLVTGFIKAQG